jgi:hypothetical protein
MSVAPVGAAAYQSPHRERYTGLPLSSWCSNVRLVESRESFAKLSPGSRILMNPVLRVLISDD